MIKTILAYIFAVPLIGWGSGIILMPLTPVTTLMPRNSRVGREAVAFVSGLGVLIAVLVFNWGCGKLGVETTYTMLILPFFGLLSNDLHRIRRAQTIRWFVTIDLNEDPQSRHAIVSTEKTALVRDITGFMVATVLISPLRII